MWHVICTEAQRTQKAEIISLIFYLKAFEEKFVKQNLRTIIIATFVTTTAIFAILNAYTSYTYFTVYKAIRDLNISVRKFNVEFLDANVSISTTVTFDNPSEYTFEARGVEKRLSLQGQFILIEGVYAFAEPLQIHPMSSINVTIQAEITDEEKTEWIKKWYNEDWLAEIKVWVNGPLVNEFLHDQWTLIKVTR